MYITRYKEQICEMINYEEKIWKW